MKLTSKARYAVMAVADLALYSALENGNVILKDIAERQDISISYLEQLFAKLRKVNIVQSARGPGGGYELSRNPGEISVWDIITAVDETIEVSRCKGKGDCIYGEKCITHTLWFELTNTISQYLKQTTILSIVKSHLEDEVNNNDFLDKLSNYALESRLRSEREKARPSKRQNTDNRINILNILEDIQPN